MNMYPYQSYQGPYPTYYAQRTWGGTIDARQALNAAAMGFVVGGSGAFGVNLHKVRADQMTMNDAIVDAVAKGAGAGVATAAAHAAVSSVGGTGILRFAVMTAAATGVIYLLNSIGKQTAGDTVVAPKKTK